MSPLTADLSAYIAAAARKPLPAPVTERAKIHLVDTFAAMISGSELLPGRKAVSYVKTLGGKPEASVLGTRIVTSVPNAVLANGMCAHADETDDAHSATRTHPGAGVVPAVMAIGERDRLSGAEVLRAMVLGYDMCARLILAITESYFGRVGYLSSAFGRAFGAAVAAGTLLKLNARQVRYLLSYTAQQAAGLFSVLRDTEHVEKAFMAGKPAHDGVVSALVVEQGFTGVEDVFSGTHNFFSTYAPAADLGQLTRELGRDFEILRCGIKRWASGGPTQGPLSALRELIAKYGLNPVEVDKVVVGIRDSDLVAVASSEMANISLQHLLAVMLVDGTVTFHSTHDYERMKDPQVIAVRKRIEVIGDPALNQGPRDWRCSMEVTLKGGRKIVPEMEPAKGSHDNPLGREDESEKALDLIAPVLGKKRTQELLALLWNFDQIKDVRSLRPLITA